MVFIFIVACKYAVQDRHRCGVCFVYDVFTHMNCCSVRRCFKEGVEHIDLICVTHARPYNIMCVYIYAFLSIFWTTQNQHATTLKKKQQSSLLADAVTPIQGVPAHTPLCAHTSDSLRRIIVHYGIEKAQQVRFVWSQQNGQVLSTHNLRKFISLDWLIFLLRPTIINWKLERIRINIFVINCISSNNVQIEVRRGDMLFTADTPQTNWHCLGDMIAIVW